VLLVAGLTTAALAAWRWRPALVPAALVGGCVAVLAFQVVVFPRNDNLNDYRFPTSVTATQAALQPRYPGTVLVVVNGPVAPPEEPGVLSRELMYGNMLQAVGVQAVNSYYGMGFKAFTDALCLQFNGSVCPEALARVWRPPAPGAPPLADLLRLETVVVQNGLPGVAAVPVPDGWRVAERTAAVTVLRRIEPLPRPEGRLSDAPAGTVVVDDVAEPRAERVRFGGGPGGTVTFARLAWPGHTARLDGVPVPVRQGPAGLLTVDVPAGAHELTLAWSPPGFRLGVGSALLGLVLALGHVAARAAGRRRRPPSAPAAAPPPGSPPPVAVADPRPATEPATETGRPVRL
jgi:hypothetical protein